MQVAIHGKSSSHDIIQLITRLLKYLSEQQAQVFFTPPLHTLLSANGIAGLTLPPAQQQLDLMISIGGDGTLLEAVDYVAAAETPILGINKGRVGFLATVSPQNSFEALKQFMQEAYELDSRALLQLKSTKLPNDQGCFALNEVAVLRQDSSSMLAIHLCIDHTLRTTYWADGLIIATPTGSTGYSLSCGGPIVFPSAKSFVITPISPHNLSVRPLVVPDTALITLKIESRNRKLSIACDGRSRAIHTDGELHIQKANFQAQLIKVIPDNLFDTLREKLHWGLDIRN